MSVSIDDLPLEIIALILSDLDQASLLSVIKMARSLRSHAERLLYRKVDLREVPMSEQRTVDFLNAVIRNPRLGSLVSSFHPHDFTEYRETDEFNDLLADAAKFLPNLKTLAILQESFYPKWLQGDSPRPLPFHLQRLSLSLYRNSTDAWEVFRFLLQVLQRQPTLLQISFWIAEDDDWDRCISESEASGALEMICPSLDILEGTNGIIRLLLPKGRVKSLYWQCDRPEDEPLRPAADLERDSRLRDTFFTPGHCEAYGRLEHLVLYNQISLLPILSPYLLSLKTLELFASLIMEDQDPYSVQCNEALFMRAIGEIEHLEVLEVTWMQDEWCQVKLDPKVIFATCRNLRRFALTIRGTRTVYRADCMEKGEDRSLSYVTHCTSPVLPHLKFEKKWFYF